MEQKSLYMAHCCEYHVRILPNNREVLQNALALQLANDVSLVEYNQPLEAEMEGTPCTVSSKTQSPRSIHPRSKYGDLSFAPQTPMNG
jgi:hypothetical protein